MKNVQDPAMDVDGAMVTDDCDQTVVVDQDAAMDVEGAMVTDTGNVENFQNAENENGAGDNGKLDVEQEAEGHKDKEPMDDDKSNSVMPRTARRTEITVPGPGTQPLPSESPNAPNAEINEISSFSQYSWKLPLQTETRIVKTTRSYRRSGLSSWSRLNG
jgi:hypothetical protein